MFIKKMRLIGFRICNLHIGIKNNEKRNTKKKFYII